MASPFEGVAALIAFPPAKPANRLAWLLALDEGEIARLLAACTGALIDACHGKYADPARLRCVDRIARAANLDMRDHWEGGVEFFGAISKKAMLAALTEACGKDAADNCAKLPKPDLALACAERIPGRGWLPPALITPEEPEPEAEDGEQDADEAEALDECPFADADNDDQHSAVAAE